VVAAEPDNQRAQGYFGLALMRAGELGQARDAFHKAGQEELARQVEERMAHLGEEAVVYAETLAVDDCAKLLAQSQSR